MNNPLFSKLFPKIGVDFGSSRIRVCTMDQEVAIDQPSCLAVNTKTKEVLAVGTEALNLQGRIQGLAEVFWPVRQGVVHDPSLALAFLKIVLQPVLRSSFLYTPIIMVSVPASSSQVDRENMTKLFYDLGAREVYTIAQPLAASIGAGVPIADSSGSFLLQMGGEIVEAGVTSLGSLVNHQSSEKGGKYLINQIILELQQTVGLEIGFSEAEKLLHTVASVIPETNRQILITGKETKQGNPMELKITAKMLHNVIQPQVEGYRTLLQRLLAKIQPELTIDVIDKGLLLSGGLSELHGLDRYLLQSLGMPVSVVDEPQFTCIRGIQTALNHLDEYTESLGYVA
jgi:rod shape-determining protein MreB